MKNKPLVHLKSFATEKEAIAFMNTLKNPDKYTVFTVTDLQRECVPLSCVIPQKAAQIIFENDVSDD